MDEPTKEYMVAKMNFNSESPKIFAKLFTYKSRVPLTIEGSLSKFSDYKLGIEKLLRYFGKDYIKNDFRKSILINGDSVSVEVRGHPRKVMPLVSYLSINTKIITENEFKEYLDNKEDVGKNDEGIK